MTEPTLEDFTRVYDIPYTVVTALYLLAKYVIVGIVLIVRCYDCCNDEDICDSCCSWWRRFNTWLIRVIFGKSEGVSEENEQQALQNEEGKVYINAKEVEGLDISILGVIIMCFLLLLAVTAYSTYLLEVTNTCSDDPAIYCYARFINPGDLANSSFSAAELLYPIDDCSVWINNSVSAQVTFQCFRYAYNAKEALATAGGLLALFVVGTRVTLAIFLKISKCLDCCGGRCLKALQITVFLVFFAFNTGAVILIMAVVPYTTLGEQETEADPIAQLLAVYIADNGIQFLIISGTVELLLLMSWHEYAQNENNPENTENNMELERVAEKTL